jgi:hypothetical protein
MPTESTTALIAAGSAVGGGLIVAGFNYLIYRAQARDVSKERLRAAFESFRFVVHRVDLLLRREPKPGRTATALIATIARLFPSLSDQLTRLSQRIFEPHLEALAQDVARAMAMTLLVAPLSTRPALQAVGTLMDHAKGRDDVWWSEWDSALDRLAVAFLEALAEPVGKPIAPLTSSQTEPEA